jgi:hypothetical protein
MTSTFVSWINFLSIAHAWTVLSAQQGAPRFEDYPATDTLRGAPVAPNLTNPDDRQFRTVLKGGAAMGPNFAGAYTVVIWGCGTSCQTGAMIDGRTGRVRPLPQSLARGAEFKLTSRLFVVDPVPPRPQPYESPYTFYYEWRESTFVLVDSLRAPSPSASGTHRSTPTQPEPPCRENPHLVGPCLKIRGVLSPANGSPSLRIWRVGTKRILGVEEQSERLAGHCALPQYLRDTIDLGHKEIIADFVVCPLTPSQPGMMQMVCVDTASQIVTRHSRFFGPN